MDKEAVCVTKQEKMRLKDQLLAFVERVSVPYPVSHDQATSDGGETVSRKRDCGYHIRRHGNSQKNAESHAKRAAIFHR